METTFDRVARLIADGRAVDRDTIKAESTLEDLGLDSLDLVEIVMATDEEFGIEISDDQMAELNCVDDLVKLVEKLRS